MRIRFHRFLLILLMLGLPVQTFAAASMLVCAAGHPAPLGHHATAATESMSGCHEPEPSPPQSHDCKHCTVCALASALPIPVSATARWAADAPTFQPLAAVSFSGYIPDGPERPPRTSLA